MKHLTDEHGFSQTHVNAVVIAWNQSMLTSGSRYVFGASVSAKHILVGPRLDQ